MIAVSVAILKPWGATAPAATRPAVVDRGVAEGSREPAPPPATADPALELVASFCLQPTGWRLFARETFDDQQVRSWKTMDPIASATGPDDPAIPMFEEASRKVLTLGYCAPVEGPERPPGATTTTIFQRVEAGPGRSAWPIIRPPRVQPTSGDSRYGGAWAPPTTGSPAIGSPAPTGSALPGWPSGTFVFRIIGEAAGATARYERWFGIVVDILPPP